MLHPSVFFESLTSLRRIHSSSRTIMDTKITHSFTLFLTVLHCINTPIYRTLVRSCSRPRSWVLRLNWWGRSVGLLALRQWWHTRYGASGTWTLPLSTLCWRICISFLFQCQREGNAPENFNLFLSGDLLQPFCTGYRWYNFTITRILTSLRTQIYTNYLFLLCVYEAYFSLDSLDDPSNTAAIIIALRLMMTFVKYCEKGSEIFYIRHLPGTPSCRVSFSSEPLPHRC